MRDLLVSAFVALCASLIGVAIGMLAYQLTAIPLT
jgi:hypothetical protein